MKVTDVKIFELKKKSGNLVGFASVTFDEALVVKGLKIVEGKKGLFVSMPSSKGTDDTYYDDVFPLNRELKEDIEEAVLDAYENQDEEEEEEKKTS